MGQIRRDVRRLVSLPAPWLMLSIVVLLAVGAAVSMMFLHAPPSPALALGFLPAIAGLFGAVSAGADFRFGAIAAEIFVVGGRIRYVARTLRAVALVAAVGGGAGVVATTAAWLFTLDHLPGPGRLAALLLGAIGGSVCWAVLGAAVAVVAQGQIGAVASVLGYLMIVEPLLEISAGKAATLLPGHAAVELLSLSSIDEVAIAGCRLLIVAIVAAGVAAIVIHRREVAVTPG